MKIVVFILIKLVAALFGSGSLVAFFQSREQQLRTAIENHRKQRADDRCIEDDDRLYAALGDGIKCDRRIGSPEAMHANCWRFITNRCESGGPWVSYAELEAKLATVVAERDELLKRLS